MRSRRRRRGTVSFQASPRQLPVDLVREARLQLACLHRDVATSPRRA
ncbi:MAG: hypothetical protein JO329_11920 [Planctomycetaceae bacterium]|nr:hypothetical protein [Planctomycetaceae bacterium]MBV8269477.1 hypothetical protein [Planctomycetaceae bacterium]MBV8316858.1 hypothetical protein [Planctomycetaceae bacterium]MBV8553929.1 hypothetical protein [Planctomycetaceae bacterium]MBV8610792.1 hypothetical protein [Singulisphaera sp.]